MFSRLRLLVCERSKPHARKCGLPRNQTLSQHPLAAPAGQRENMHGQLHGECFFVNVCMYKETFTMHTLGQSTHGRIYCRESSAVIACFLRSEKN